MSSGLLHSLPIPQQNQTNVEWQQWERVKDQPADGLHFNTRLVTHGGTLRELIQRYEDKLKTETEPGQRVQDHDLEVQ